MQRFGPEDKFEYCNDVLTFIDLDGNSNDRTPLAYQYATRSGVWSKTPIVALPCPDPNQGSLLPRVNGYTVGQTIGPLGDRLLILGGNDGENNVRCHRGGYHLAHWSPLQYMRCASSLRIHGPAAIAHHTL